MNCTNILYAELYQIDVDNFDKDTMRKIFRTHGSFEVVGKSVDDLNQAGLDAFEESRTVLNLPLETLNKVYNEGFNGFQNVYKETIEKFERTGIGSVRRQFAFHYKPKNPKVPEGLEDLPAYRNYHNKTVAFLNRLYDLIAESFIEPDKKSVFDEKAQTSVVTSRKYFTNDREEMQKYPATGIDPHSDYGILTLLASLTNGLVVLEGENIKVGKWIEAPYGEQTKLRFYINIGDWLLFQTGNKEFVAGVHYVPAVKDVRYSLATFLNPRLEEKGKTFTDIDITYGEFLKSNKSAYHVNPRLDVK